jgi:hypothetical protein
MIKAVSKLLLVLTCLCAILQQVRVKAVYTEEEWHDPRFMVIHSCMYGYALAGIYSKYDEQKKDRTWEFNCTVVNERGNDTCRWTCE